VLSLPAFPRLSHALARLSRAISWTLLVLGLLLGIAWGLLHFWIVPRIGDWRPQLENLARQSLGMPVRIGQISAQSTGWAPSFELQNIELLDPQGRTALSLPRVVVAISVQSVARLRLEQLVLDAPELDIRLTADGHWQVAGLSLNTSASGDSAAADWFFSQREIIVRGGTVRWTNERAPAAAANTPLALREVDLIIRNSVLHNDLRLDATPPSGWGERFVLMGRFKRSLLSTHAGRFKDWSGQTYAWWPQVDVSQLRQHVRLGEGMDVASGHGALRLWSDIQRGQWTGGVADVQLKDVNVRLGPQLAPVAFDRLSGRVGTRLTAKGFEVHTRDLAFVSAQGLVWPGGNVALQYSHPQAARATAAATPAQGQIKADHLDLQALRELALRLPLPVPVRAQLQAQDIGGEVTRLELNWQGDWQAPSQYSAQASARQLHWLHTPAPGTTPAISPPGVRGAQLSLDLNQDGGKAQLDMDGNGALHLNGILEDPVVPVHRLHAQARWQKTADRWDVPQWQLQFANADLQGQWHGQWRASDSGPGLLDLQGTIARAQATRAHRYLPLSLPEPVRHYVRDAITQGSYNGVQVRIKGDLAKLPFADPKDGEFRFAGRVRDVGMNYMPAGVLPQGSAPWPRLSSLNGQLVFDRLGLKFSEGTGRIGDELAADGKSGAVLSNLQAEIPDMVHQATLDVSGEGRTTASQVLALIQQSPLEQLLGGVLHDTQATGPVQARIKLNIPLLAAHNTKVQGAVVLGGNDLRMAPNIPLLEKTQGTLQFSESGFSLNGAQARLLGGPLRLEGGMRPGTANTDEPAVLLRAQGQASAEALRQTPELYPLDLLARQASGTTHYSASLGWRQGQPELNIQTTLDGVALHLPTPLNKTANASLPLSVRTRVTGQGKDLRDQLQIELGQLASVHYVRDLSGPMPRVLRGTLALGTASAPPLPESGVSAVVLLQDFSVDDWQALWPAHVDAGEALRNTTWQSYLPHRMGLQANTLTADGRTLHQVVAGGTREGLTWKANVDAREMSGHVEYRPPSGEHMGHLYARLARLNLPPSTAADVEALLEAPPAQLPALDIVVDQLELRGKKLGRIEIEAINLEAPKARLRQAPEWQLNQFNIVLPEGSLRSTGRWRTATEGHAQRQTDMNFTLSVNDAGALLTRLGTPDALRGGSGQLQGTIQWQGSPLALHYPSMNGHFKISMGRGQFLKADAGAAKLLGVLSLQALPRRLLLDFRDVFYDGFAFDTVKGDVDITQGIASTRNLHIQGVNASVRLDGSADIAHETQNLRAVILPELDAGTASLVAGITVNPVIGLTSFLAQWFLQNPLARASTQEFLIDGSWNAPRVTRVEPTAATQPTRP
jgi:uncharacterized protein (TIGR02099 family)